MRGSKVRKVPVQNRALASGVEAGGMASRRERLSRKLLARANCRNAYGGLIGRRPEEG